MSRRVLAVIGCIMLGTAIGGVERATGRSTTVRTCEEVEPGVMTCDDGTTCYLIDGIWICDESQYAGRR